MRREKNKGRVSTYRAKILNIFFEQHDTVDP